MKYPKHLKKKLNLFPKVLEIIGIENSFKAILRWNTGEIKVIDFKKHYFKLWKDSKHPFFILTKWVNFKKVQIGEDKTLNWAKQGLAIDPDVLYDLSEPLSDFTLQRVSTAKSLAGVKK